MTSIECLSDKLKDCILSHCGSEFSSDLAICQNMHCEKSECPCCVDLYTGYTQSAAFSFYPEQAPYNSGLPPPGQFMSDMEGMYKFMFLFLCREILTIITLYPSYSSIYSNNYSVHLYSVSSFTIISFFYQWKN